MAQEIDLGGTIYISSKRAAEITGYTQDYIGQLARAGSIAAQRVSGLWYVIEESLRGYKAQADEFKPEPPKAHVPVDLESAVSFDGKDYVSAQRAAKITGYHQDYVGQLARSGKIVSRQIGNRWYVDREALVEHKRHNDALLAAVQTESVGLARASESDTAHEVEKPEEDLHFTYVEEPERLQFMASIEPRNEGMQAEIGEDEDRVNEIPIRVIRPVTTSFGQEYMRHPKTVKFSNFKVLGMYAVLGVIVIASAAGGYLYFLERDSMSPVIARSSVLIQVAMESAARIPVPEFMQKIVAKELYYRRDSF